MAMTLWSHLWGDDMLGWARRWGGLAQFAVFKGEGRHKALKAGGVEASVVVCLPLGPLRPCQPENSWKM